MQERSNCTSHHERLVLIIERRYSDAKGLVIGSLYQSAAWPLADICSGVGGGGGGEVGGGGGIRRGQGLTHSADNEKYMVLIILVIITISS